MAKIEPPMAPYTYNITMIMGYKTREKKLQASSLVLSSISIVWESMLKDVRSDETKVWRCDSNWYEGLKVVLELAHHKYDFTSENPKRETVQLIGILGHKLGLQRFLRTHNALWREFFDKPAEGLQDGFQIQMHWYVTEAIGSRVQFIEAWRALFLRVKVDSGGGLSMEAEAGASEEGVNDALVSKFIQGDISFLKSIGPC